MNAFNINLEGGTPVRLTTAGKYCDRDIIVTPEDLTESLSEQGSLIAQIQTALAEKCVPSAGLPTQEKTVEITENGEFDIVPDVGHTLSKVALTVNVGEPDPREGYQRVEYITTAEEGTYPYIVTDFHADNESGMEIVASFPVLQDRIPMGSRENSDATRFYCVYPMSSNSIYYGFNTGSTISCQLKVNTIYRLQTNFLNSRLINAYDDDGNRKGGGAISGTLSPAHSAPVSIFGYNYAATGAVSSKREFKLYSARCSQGHEVVREYIPCRRKSDGAVGVYEKFSGTFWGNDDPEDSAFIAGPDIEWEV